MNFQNNSTGEGQKIELNDDIELLDIMLSDSKSQPPLYHPGPYWASKAKNSANEIKRCGIGDFRGSRNLIGLSYADNLITDYRFSLNNGMPKNVVKNYVDKFERFPESTNSAVALTTYRDFDPNTTFDPHELPLIFEDRKFDSFDAGTLVNSSKNIFFISPGKLSF